MTCDLKMTLAFEAEKTLRPLSDLVRKLEKQLAHLRHRLETERGNVAKRETDLESLKAAASSYLAENTFPTFQVRLKRVTAELAAARESVVLFETDLVPRTEKGLQEARQKLTDAFAALTVAARSDCENRLTELLGAVIAEYDNWLAAIRELAKTYGTSFNGPPPVASHPRLDELRRTLSRRWVTFSKAPAAPCPVAAVLDVPEAVGSTPTPEVGESAKGDGPRAETLAPERTSAAAAPLDADIEDEDPGTPGPDPLPLDVDAEAAVDDDAEAPPEAEKENL